MDVFVLMADGGYEGDSLLGVYGSEKEAEENARQWEQSGEWSPALTYVVSIQVDDAPKMHFNDPAL